MRACIISRSSQVLDTCAVVSVCNHGENAPSTSDAPATSMDNCKCLELILAFARFPRFEVRRQSHWLGPFRSRPRAEHWNADTDT